MKKNVKIIIFVCVIVFAIAIIILSSILDKKSREKANKDITANRINNSINNNGNNEGDNYIQITYEATSEVFKIAGTDKTITIYQDFPTVVASDESVKNKLQAGIGKIANAEFAEYKKKVQDRINTKDDINAAFMEHFGNLQLKWSFINDRNDDKVVSIRNESSGNLGGVSWATKRGYSFSAETGDLLTIDNIAVNKEALRKYLNESIIKYIKSNYQKLGVSQDKLENITNTINIDDLTWYFSGSGLTVCFEKYKISPDSIEYTIDYDKLKDLVKDEYLK